MKQKKEKKLLKINFLFFLFLGFLVFTLFSFFIVLRSQKISEEKPATFSCSKIDLIENELTKLIPGKVFLTKALNESQADFDFSWKKNDFTFKKLKSEKENLIIIEGIENKKILQNIKKDLDISLLGYGIYSNQLNSDNLKLGYHKNNFLFSISIISLNDIKTQDKNFTIPKNSTLFIIKCTNDNQ